MEENSSISIINRSGSTLTGEKAQALPIKITGSLSWSKYVLIGFVVAIVLAIIFVATIKKSVVAVEVSGKSDQFQIFQVQ